MNGTTVYNGREVLKAGSVLGAFRVYMNAHTFPFTYDMAAATFE